MKIAILYTTNTWFDKYAAILRDLITESGNECELHSSHKEMGESYDIVFILSYFNIVPMSFLENNGHNIVIHASDLPSGKGWAPFFWQILEGKNRIPVCLFEASEEVDAGDIYLRDNVLLDRTELHDELREKLAKTIINMCVQFVENISNLESEPQSGESTFYPKRTPKDSELDIHKTIDEQFNLLRIVNNDKFPAYFYKNGKKYILKIFKENDEDS